MTEELLDLSDIAKPLPRQSPLCQGCTGEVARVPDAGTGYQPKNTALERISRHRDLKILMAHYYRETPDQIAARI